MRAQLARVDAVLVQALIAAALSFAHLHDIASAAGQDGWKAWAYPVSVDLLLVAAWRRLRSGEARAAGWCWFVIALAASLGANVATAGLLDLDNVPAWLRILVAGWPAVAFLGGTLLAHTTPATTGEDHKGVSANRRFRNVTRIGPVQVATSYDGRSREKHTAACTAPRCGFSADYDSRAAAELAARTHRCPVR